VKSERQSGAWLRLFTSTRVQLALTLAVMVGLIVEIAVSYRTNQLIEGFNKPELSINKVYLSELGNGELDLVMEYQNVGRARMRWLGIALKLIKNDSSGMSVEETIDVVLGNPFLPGVGEQTANKLTQPATPLLALCGRWLDDREVLSTSEWYYSLASQQLEPKIRRYVDADAEERAQMKDLNACREVFGGLH
jgi:hypothetical protein